MPIVIAYANFETLDMAIGFYKGKVPDGYVPIFIESQLNELITERNNAEKREFEILGRANALEAEIERLRAALVHIECEPINAEYMARAALDGPNAQYTPAKVC